MLSPFNKFKMADGSHLEFNKKTAQFPRWPTSFVDVWGLVKTSRVVARFHQKLLTEHNFHAPGGVSMF